MIHPLHLGFERVDWQRAARALDRGPLTGRETSKQDEPLCTKEQVTRALAQELERTPAHVLAITNGTRPQLFAFAALVAEGKLPASFTTAHARW